MDARSRAVALVIRANVAIAGARASVCFELAACRTAVAVDLIPIVAVLAELTDAVSARERECEHLNVDTGGDRDPATPHGEVNCRSGNIGDMGSRWCEDLNTIILRVSYVHVSRTIYGNPSRSVELSAAAAGIEQTRPLASGGSACEANAALVRQLAVRPASALPKPPLKRPSQILLHPVVIGICNVDHGS
jgi:hypothetical protein